MSHGEGKVLFSSFFFGNKVNRAKKESLENYFIAACCLLKLSTLTSDYMLNNLSLCGKLHPFVFEITSYKPNDLQKNQSYLQLKLSNITYKAQFHSMKN
jgi:hypothetical protein